MMHMANTYELPYYAVIFISKRKNNDSEFDKMQQLVGEKIKNQEGFLGRDSFRNPDGLSISISYWDSLENLKDWGILPEHANAQAISREKWYSEYVLRVCKVEYDKSFSFNN